MIAKSAEEIALLRESGRTLARYVRILTEMVAPGVRALDLEMRARQLVEEGGDEPVFLGYPSGKKGQKFPGVLCVSVNDVLEHCPAYTSGTVFEEGDVVSVDFGIRHKGFVTDHAHTVIAGTPKSEKDARLVRHAYEALAAGIKAARVGNTTGDIGFAVEQVAKREGYGYPKNLCGHGVGREMHEKPNVPNFGMPGSGEPLVEGLVIAIEPMFTLGSGELYVDEDHFSYRTKDGSTSVQVEHSIIVTKDGPEILTKE